MKPEDKKPGDKPEDAKNQNDKTTATTDKKEFVGEVVVGFKVGVNSKENEKKRKEYFPGDEFKTNDEKTYNYLISTKRIK